MLLSINIWALAQDNSPKTEIDPKKKDDIMKLQNLMGLSVLGIEVKDYVVSHFKSVSGTVDSLYWVKLEQDIDPNGYLELNIPVFDNYFDHGEVIELIKFYESEVGRKVTAKMGDINQLLGGNQGRFADMIKEKLMEQLTKDGKIDVYVPPANQENELNQGEK